MAMLLSVTAVHDSVSEVQDKFVTFKPVGGLGGVPTIFHTNVAFVVPTAFVAVMVELYVPTVVGVPVISPIAGLMLKPGGKPVAENVVGAGFAWTLSRTSTGWLGWIFCTSEPTKTGAAGGVYRITT